MQGLVTQNIKSRAVTLALECDSDLKRDSSKNMACSFYEIFLILYSESYLLTLETQILCWKATVSNAGSGTRAKSKMEGVTHTVPCFGTEMS